MALFRRKMRRETAAKQRYIRYFKWMKSAGKLRQTLTYAQWQKSKERITIRKPKRKPLKRRKPVKKTKKEFKTIRTTAIEKKLRRAGVTKAQIRKLRGKR